MLFFVWVVIYSSQKDILKEKEAHSCCCRRPTFIYNLLSSQSTLHRLSAPDIIDVSIRKTGVDWRRRSIPLHLACVVSTCLSLRQTLWEIVWSRDGKGSLFWSASAGLQRDWAHRFDLHPASWKNGHSSDIRVDLTDSWACNACSSPLSSYFKFTYLVCSLLWKLPKQPQFSHGTLQVSIQTAFACIYFCLLTSKSSYCFI